MEWHHGRPSSMMQHQLLIDQAVLVSPNGVASATGRLTIADLGVPKWRGSSLKTKMISYPTCGVVSVIGIKLIWYPVMEC